MPRQPNKPENPVEEERDIFNGFSSPPLAPPDDSDVRVILVGITGSPEQWEPVYKTIEQVCRPMIFPFSPDQPEKDKTVCANVIEYADVASDLKGELISGDPTMVFCLPGIDRNRRIGLLAEVLPRALSHHRTYGSLLYYGQDRDELFAGIMEAQFRGFTAHKVGETPGDLDKEALQRWWHQWLVELDPMNQS